MSPTITLPKPGNRTGVLTPEIELESDFPDIVYSRARTTRKEACRGTNESEIMYI